ncbi:MAG: hypothetical protein HY814_14265 [Candidatus Riflebacteria bacterium]|nr:hypothetical protein [Candidatus Riflebacteria bacterium]
MVPKNITLLNLTGATVDADGVWTYVGNMDVPFTIHVTGSGAGDSIVLNGSCKVPVPAAGTHDVVLATVTTDGFTTVSTPVTWVKSRKAAATQSSTVFLQGFIR